MCGALAARSQAAPAAGIGLARASVPLCTLRALLLLGGCLVVALVDKSTLGSGACGALPGCSGGGPWLPGRGCPRDCDLGSGDRDGCCGCAQAAAASEQPQGEPRQEGDEGAPSESAAQPSAYSGHYVVLCGYDAACDEFEIRDPASSRQGPPLALRETKRPLLDAWLGCDAARLLSTPPSVPPWAPRLRT